MITEKEVQHLCRIYTTGNVSLEQMGISHNIVYKVQGENPFILRITPRGHRRKDELLSEIDFLFFLTDKGIETGRPIFSLNNEMVAEYQTGGESYFVTAFTFAQGRHWMQRQNDLDRLQLIGRALGRLHSRAKRYTPGKAVIRRRAYSESQHLIQAHKVLPKYDPALYDCFTKFLSTLASLPKSADTFGLTHGDFLFSNYHITDDDRVILFDFDECEYSWYVSDIAVCLYYYLLGGDPSELDGKTEDAERFLVSLMSGYLRENDLPPEELRRIELFFRLRDYILLSTIIGRGEKTLGGWDQAFLDSTLPRVTGNQPFAGIDIDTVGRRLYPF